MAYTKTQARPVIPTPATATLELHNSTVASLTTHYKPLLPPELLIANRSSCYGLIINTVIDTAKLEVLLGSANAKVATEQTLDNLMENISTITTTKAVQPKGGFSK